MYANCYWGDDFRRKRSSGWKEHKNTKQWEARQKRTPAAWVSEKRSIMNDVVEIDDIVFDE
jgi:hypothetical protein